MSRKTTPTYVLLNQITLAATSSSVTFSSIPQNYGDLVLSLESTANTSDATFLSMNGSSSGASVFMLGKASGPLSGTNLSRMDIGYHQTGERMSVVTQIMDYPASDKFKTFLTRDNAQVTQVVAWAGRSSSTNAITSLSVSRASGVFSVGSTFSLYGLVA